MPTQTSSSFPYIPLSSPNKIYCKMIKTCTKDSAITLFGKKIPLPADEYSPAASVNDSFESEKVEEDSIDEEYEEVKDSSANKIVEDNQAPTSDSEKSADPESSPDSNVNPKTPAISEESAKSKTSKAEREQNDSTTNTQEKTLKKPDKILPCPRCNSMDTKFCYYNNYNVNQPRHFCKACQRYWTAGGTMRNVPVGAGRRKNKNSASHYHHITISEALQAARIEVANGAHHSSLKTNGRVLSFGLDAPICDSMASVLNLADKKGLNGTRNGFHVIEDQRIRVPNCEGGENGDDCSSGSSVTVSNSVEEGGRVCPPQSFVHNINGAYPSPIPCISDVPWPYPALPPPAFYPPGISLSFYPAAYWNCGMTAPWNIHLLSPSRTSSNQKVSGTNPSSSTLGKHSRDINSNKSEVLENKRPANHKNGCVLVPKILRIDDPTEAAMSSIWTTLGIKNESFSEKGGLFKGFQSKCEDKNRKTEKASPILMANPAALSRSANFHENT